MKKQHSLLCAILLLLCAACTQKESDMKSVILFGDSITDEFAAPEGCYTDKVKSKLALDKVYQLGYCAHRYSRGASATHDYEAWLGSYLDDVCSHPDAEMIILFAGTNDYGHNMPLGTPADTTVFTSCGGLRHILHHLTSHTEQPIMLCTPFPNGALHPLSTTPNATGLTMAQYVEAYKAVAADTAFAGRVFINDTFANCGFDPANEVEESDRIYTTDGLHLSDAGYERLTDLQAAFYLTMQGE